MARFEINVPSFIQKFRTPNVIEGEGIESPEQAESPDYFELREMADEIELPPNVTKVIIVPDSREGRVWATKKLKISQNHE